MFTIKPEEPSHAEQIEHLLDKAFGPGRYTRTAYVLREGIDPVPGLSFITCTVGPPSHMAGSIRFSPILIGEMPALLLGPLVMEPTLRGQGGGQKLMSHALDTAREQGHGLVILVGDEPYYTKAGFVRIPPGRMTLPGPVDPTRLLYKELKPGAFDGVTGPVRGDTR